MVPLLQSSWLNLSQNWCAVKLHCGVPACTELKHPQPSSSACLPAGAAQGCLSHAWPCQSAPAGLDSTQWAAWRSAFSTASLKLTLLVLLLASSLQGSLAWPFRHPPPPELVGLETTWQCTELKPWQHPNRTVCEFRNALIFNGDLWVFSNTTQPLPSISRDFWLTNVILDVRQIRDPADIVYFSPELPAVTRFKSAVAQWWVFHQNYFHIMAEVSLPDSLHPAARAAVSSWDPAWCTAVPSSMSPTHLTSQHVAKVSDWAGFSTLACCLEHRQHQGCASSCQVVELGLTAGFHLPERWGGAACQANQNADQGASWRGSHSLSLCALLCP